MDKKQIIIIASVAGAAYLAYWYVTNFGPQDGLTWWDSWFGAPPQPQPGVPNGTSTVVQNPQVQAQPQPQVNNPVAPQPVNSLRDQLLAASNGDAFFTNGVSDAFHWGWYRDRLTNNSVPANIMDAAFPGGADFVSKNLITVDQYLSALQGAGFDPMTGRLSGIVNTPATVAQQVTLPKSMSFGGGGGLGGMKPMGGYKN